MWYQAAGAGAYGDGATKDKQTVNIQTSTDGTNVLSTSLHTLQSLYNYYALLQYRMTFDVKEVRHFFVTGFMFIC